MTAFALLVLALVPQSAEKEITADEVVARHFEALGGEEALRALTAVKRTGTYVYNGHEHPVVQYLATGQRSREEIDGLLLWGTGVAEGQRVIRGTDGEALWNLDPSRDDRWSDIPAPRAAVALAEAHPVSPLLDAAKSGYELRFDGLGELDGTPAYRLVLELAPGLEQLLFIDADSYLLLGKELLEDGLERDLERPRTWFYDDYRAVGGVLLPFWVFVEEALFTREYQFEEAQANPSLEESLFEAPAGASRTAP